MASPLYTLVDECRSAASAASIPTMPAAIAHTMQSGPSPHRSANSETINHPADHRGGCALSSRHRPRNGETQHPS